VAIALPDYPYPAAMTPRLVTGRAELRPAWGGDIQRLNRAGSRFAIDVTMPVMTYADAQDWSGINDQTDTVTMQIVQPGLDTGAPGVTLVNGASQSGSTLIIDGLTPYYVLRKNQWISVLTGGRLYAYRVKTEVIASSGGAASVVLTTMLRVSPANNDPVEIAVPRIEGFATVPDDAWATNTAGHVALSFTIEERG
jgi:hypothetical protein